MSLTYTTITGTFDDGSGAPATGTATFTPSESVYASGVPVVSTITPVAANVVNGSLFASGGGALKLLATDNAGLAIEGLTGFWYWTVQVAISGQAQAPWSFFLPFGTLGAGPVDLYSLANTAAGGGGGFTNPMTTLGDLIGGGASGAAVRLAADTSNTRKFLRELSSGGVAAAPAWDTLQAGDIPALAYDASGAAAAVQASSLQKASNLADLASRQAALDTLAGATTSGQFPRGNGTHVAMSAIQAADLPAFPADQPYQFRPEAYGALGDVKLVSDAAITSAQHQLTSATAGFTSGDAGKTIYVAGAGAAGADLFTTIATFTSSTTVQLTAAAGTTVTGKGCIWHTDDTAAVKSAYAAAHAYALASPSRRGQIVLSKLYGLAGAPVIGGGTLGNAIIPHTIVTATSTAKIRIEWTGDASSDAAELAHWLQPAPQMTGPGLVCLRLDGTNDAVNGPASVLGGPINGYGAAASLFSNMSVVLKNFRIHVPFNSAYAGADFLGVAEDYETGYACQALGIVPSGGAWPQLNQASITNQYTFGLRKGDTNNNARQDMSQYSCEGLCYGFMASEHTTWDSARTIYCINGLELYAGASMPHGIRGGHLCAEACANAVGVFGVAPFGNSVKAVIAHVDLESSQLLFDSNNLLAGSIGVMSNGTPGYGGYTVTGGQFCRINQLLMPAGPISSPQAPPSSGVAWANLYYKDAWITLSATTITGLTVTSQSGTAKAQAVPSGAATYSFLLPSGCSYTPAYTGTLTHTVCPLSYT